MIKIYEREIMKENKL